ncbi:MAG TPA: LapA family protein [Streptosporangiaceae bacterium]|jgi:uncharacterized integral membrane protein
MTASDREHRNVTPDSAQGAAQVPMPPKSHRTRFSAMWVAVSLCVVVLALLLVFILQNLQRTSIEFFGAHATVPVGVALLVAAVFGALLVVLAAVGRVAQLRVSARRHRKAAKAASAASAVPPQAGSRESDAGSQARS